MRCLLTLAAFSLCVLTAADVTNRVEDKYADSNGVKIHYAAIGKGPLIVMIHGFPDFWYTWRKQMEPLAEAGFRVAAMDLRGYNLSDKPKGIENYDMKLLMGDVLSVIRANGQEHAIIVGHDWGGAIAWNLAMFSPKAVDKLIVLNLPHPKGLAHELANNAEQQKHSAYARAFQQPGSEKALSPNILAQWVTDEEARAKYVEAMKRSDLEAMMQYYRRNYPRQENAAKASEMSYPKVKAPVLMIHGLKDKYLLPPALNNTWEWLEQDLTLVTIPQAGHFVQQDAADLVTRSMLMWLRR